MITDVKLNIWNGVVNAAGKEFQIIFKFQRKSGECVNIYFEINTLMTPIQLVRSIIDLLKLFMMEMENS